VTGKILESGPDPYDAVGRFREANEGQHAQKRVVDLFGFRNSSNLTETGRASSLPKGSFGSRGKVTSTDTACGLYRCCERVTTSRLLLHVTAAFIVTRPLKTFRNWLHLPACHAGGRGFEPRRSRHDFKGLRSGIIRLRIFRAGALT
jgi:hypothetical protein